MQRRNTITALLFLAALAAGFMLVLTSFLGGEGNLEALIKGLRQGPAGALALLEGGEAAVNKDLDRDHYFIQLYGGVQRLSGRRLIRDTSEAANVVKLSDGSLNFVYPSSQPSQDVYPNGAQTIQLRDYLDTLDIPLLFVLAPQKIERGRALLPTGVEDWNNENATAYLDTLAQGGVDFLDLRPVFEATDDYSSWFFRTDHHWRPEGAFLAWQQVAALLESGYGWATDPALTDEDNYDKIVYEDFFLGSQGKRVGSLYAGVDDITRYSPKFDTHLTYSILDSGVVREGSFDESVLFPERVAQQDWFNGNPYTLYSGGDYGFARMVNHNNPEGPKILLIRDSFACAFAPFLALSCSELITVDMRYLEQGALPETIAREAPDLVMFLYTAGTTALPNMYTFFPAGQ